MQVVFYNEHDVCGCMYPSRTLVCKINNSTSELKHVCPIDVMTLTMSDWFVSSPPVQIYSEFIGLEYHIVKRDLFIASHSIEI